MEMGSSGPKGLGAQWSRAVALWAYEVGAWQASCSFSKSWHGEAFHELGPKFQLSLVLYLSQAYLQHLSKVPDSWSSSSLRLYPSYHLGSSQKTFSIGPEIRSVFVSGVEYNGHISDGESRGQSVT
jgi:hypothetical protein